MSQRPRIAPASEVRSLRKGRGSAGPAPSRAALGSAAALVLLLAALACALPALVRPGFFFDQARGAVGFTIGAGEWIRAALTAAFQNIPVR